MGNRSFKLVSLIAGLGAAASQSLTSSLNGRTRAYPQEVVTFTCETRGSLILAWSSNDYIGQGDLLEFLSIDTPGLNRSRDNAVATLINVSIASGEVVLKSKLLITATSQFPTSSVICLHVSNGGMNTTSFWIADVPAQEVESTLHPGLTACPGDRLTFICKTRDSDSLIWSSDEYVNGQSTQLNFTAHDTPGLLLMLDDTVAALVSVSQENGVLEITCNLTITVLPSIGQHSHSVTCANSDIGTRNVTTFGPAGNCVSALTTRTTQAMGKLHFTTSSSGVHVTAAKYGFFSIMVAILFAR